VTIGICSICGHSKDLHDNPLGEVFLCYGSEKNKRTGSLGCDCYLYWNDDDKDSSAFILDKMNRGIHE
jgi:hypothetical protein